MSIRIMSRVWDEADASGGSLLVLLALANFADDDGICWPRIETVAHKARLTTRQVSSIITSLVQAGQLATKPGGGRGKPTQYLVLCGMSETERDISLKKLHGLPKETPKKLRGNEPETLKPRNFFTETGSTESGSVTPDQHEIRHGSDPSLDSDPPPQSGGGGGNDPPDNSPPQPAPDPETIQLLTALGVSASARRELGHIPFWRVKPIADNVRRSAVRSKAGAIVTELRALANAPEGAPDELRPVGSRGGGVPPLADPSPAESVRCSQISPEQLEAARVEARRILAAYHRE